jgi:hypothetical protein
MCPWASPARALCIVIACVGAFGCGGEDPTPPPHSPPFEGEGDPWIEPAPRATCRTGDKAESGLQGLGTDVRCNLDVKGQVDVEHFLSFAWYGDCAYVNSQTATSVIDASDTTKPKLVTKLTTPGMQNSWESMKVHQQRGLLVGYQNEAPIFEVYDVQNDCKSPVLLSSYNLGGRGHAGNFSPDGTIYYAASINTSQVFAVDIADPAMPRVISNAFDREAHDLFIGKNGARGYFAFSGKISHFGMGSLSIMDLSSIEARAPNPRGAVINEIVWPDGWATQYAIPVTYRGRDYLVITDEFGSGAHCMAPEKPPFGYARILDIHDEKRPTLVSKIKTEAQDPANCQTATAQAGTAFGVGTHYCNVDREDEPRLLSCALWAGGLRLFDIRNPWRPKELAYFNVPGSEVPGLTRIRIPERELWLSTNKTFYVLTLPEEIVGPILDH